MALYLYIKTVQGGVTEKGREGWITLNSVRFGVRRSTSAIIGRSNDREAAVPLFHIVEISKQFDKATNSLFHAVCLGQVFPTAEIHLYHQNDPIEKIKLYDVMIVSHQSVMMSQGLPMEVFNLHFTKIERTYIARDEKNLLQSPNSVGYDLQKVAKI